MRRICVWQQLSTNRLSTADAVEVLTPEEKIDQVVFNRESVCEYTKVVREDVSRFGEIKNYQRLRCAWTGMEFSAGIRL